MAATNGFAGPKLVFRSSEVKRDTEFYKNYIAGKLTEENFKWPECPFKFITKNHLIGAIQSPNRPDSIADIEMTDGPQSPGSSQSQETTSLSSQLLKDMVKMVKGEKTNVKDEPKSDATAPKVEPQPPVYIIYNVPNGIPNGMPNGMPNIPNISNILGMPPQTPIHVCTNHSNIPLLHSLVETKFYLNFNRVGEERHRHIIQLPLQWFV